MSIEKGNLSNEKSDVSTSELSADSQGRIEGAQKEIKEVAKEVESSKQEDGGFDDLMKQEKSFLLDKNERDALAENLKSHRNSLASLRSDLGIAGSDAGVFESAEEKRFADKNGDIAKKEAELRRLELEYLGVPINGERFNPRTVEEAFASEREFLPPPKDAKELEQQFEQHLKELREAYVADWVDECKGAVVSYMEKLDGPAWVNWDQARKLVPAKIELALWNHAQEHGFLDGEAPPRSLSIMWSFDVSGFEDAQGGSHDYLTGVGVEVGEDVWFKIQEKKGIDTSELVDETTQKNIERGRETGVVTDTQTTQSS